MCKSCLSGAIRMHSSMCTDDISYPTCFLGAVFPHIRRGSIPIWSYLISFLGKKKDEKEEEKITNHNMGEAKELPSSKPSVSSCYFVTNHNSRPEVYIPYIGAAEFRFRWRHAKFGPRADLFIWRWLRTDCICGCLILNKTKTVPRMVELEFLKALLKINWRRSLWDREMMPTVNMPIALSPPRQVRYFCFEIISFIRWSCG